MDNDSPMEQQFQNDWEQPEVAAPSAVKSSSGGAPGRPQLLMYDCVDWMPGVLALGLSALTGRRWGGGVAFLRWDGDATPALVSFAACDASVADVRLLPDGQRALVAMDSGALLLLSVAPVSVSQNYDGAYLAQACEHDALISRVAVTGSGRHAASGSHDCAIKLWDVDAGGTELMSMRTWQRAHRAEVLDLAFQPGAEQVLASAGADHAVLLWDARAAPTSGGQAATRLPSAQFNGQSVPSHSLAWLAGGEQLVLGDAAGQLHLVDRRQAAHGMVASLLVHGAGARVSRVQARGAEVASIADDMSVVLTAVADVAERPLSAVLPAPGASRHADLPHGLCWTSAEHFVSCGLESRLLQHHRVADALVSHEIALDLHRFAEVKL